MATHFSNPLYVGGVPVLPGNGLMGVAPEAVYYVRRQGANEAFPDAFGSLQTAITYAASRAAKRPVFVVLDDIREEVTIPNTLADGTIIGSATRPRHGDASPNAFGRDTSSWRNSDGVTATPLCTVRAQGWRFINLLLAGPSAEACIKLMRNDDDGLATEYDASHASILGCRFASGQDGIHVVECANVLIEGNIFNAMTGYAVKGVAGDGVANPLRGIFRNNIVQGCANGFYVSCNQWVITGNVFDDGGTPNTTTVLNTMGAGANGANNFVYGNVFQVATANFNTPDIVGSATDVWTGNMTPDAAGAGASGIYEIGQPA